MRLPVRRLHYVFGILEWWDAGTRRERVGNFLDLGLAPKMRNMSKIGGFSAFRYNGHEDDAARKYRKALYSQDCIMSSEPLSGRLIHGSRPSWPPTLLRAGFYVRRQEASVVYDLNWLQGRHKLGLPVI